MITTKTIGDSYEYFVLDSIKKVYDQVWHWSQVPEYVLYDLNIIRDYDMFSKYRYDIGADLVAKKDDQYYFIQCKNFSGTILMEQLAGFYFLLHEYNLNGILYYNGKLSQRVKDLSTGKIKFINLAFNNQTIMVDTNKEKEQIVPREYQLDAYNTLKNYNKCILSLPCGMGKTYIASMLGYHYDNIVIMAPLRYLAQQLLINMSHYLNNKYNPILISMDGSRDIDKIKLYMGNKNIFSCTYDSADIMAQLIDQLENTFLIIDEFHNLTNDINIEQIRNKINKHLYLSATPPKDCIFDYKYQYSWQNAIKNKYICDFNIIIHENNEDLYRFSYILKQLCSDSLDIKLIAKAYFMLKGMMYFGNRKCICYMTTIEKANEMYDILYWMCKLLNVEIDSWIITCNTAKTKRANYLCHFKKSNKLCIIINVHILDEGIDIPECDSVFITQPNTNIINIVQRMCRANRITENKTKCQIFLWCCKNKTNKILEYLSDNTDGIINNKVIKLNIKYNGENKITNQHITQTKKTNVNIHNINDTNTNTNNITDNNLSYINIITYLKQNTSVNHKFIDSFLKCHKNSKNYNDFTVDLEDISNLLETRKNHLKELLITHFELEKDYTETSKYFIKKGQGGHNKIFVLLNYNCFKTLCLISRNPRSHNIHKYYVEIEKILLKLFMSSYALDIINLIN